MNRIGLALAGCACLAVAAPVAAQDAAETAVVLSGSSGTAKAGRSLGNAVSQSVNSAAGAVRASNPRRRGSTRSSRRGASRGPVTIGTGDALEGTDASTYATGSGATIRVSGGFRPSNTTRCTENCEDQAAQEAPAIEPESQPDD